jgi:hypothetical protein
MWERAVAVSRFDLEKDPVFSNNSLFPCIGGAMTVQAIYRLKNLTK